MKKNVKLSERKITITERMFGEPRKQGFNKIEVVEYDIHSDNELIYHERMSAEWMKYKGIRPEIKALIRLTTAKALIRLTTAHEFKNCGDVRKNGGENIGFFRKCRLKLFKFKLKFMKKKT